MTYQNRNFNPPNPNGSNGTCQSLMKGVCEGSMDGIIIYDSTGRIESINHATQRMLGYSQAELYDQPINVLLPELELGLPRTDYLTTMTVAICKDGQSVHVELLVTEFKYDMTTHYFAVVRDMSIRMDEAESDLSPRQRQVLKLVVQGYTSREISEQLTISIKTVETHRANIMAKMGVRNVSSLVRLAVEHSII